MLLRQTFKVRSKLAQIRYPPLRVLFSTTNYSTEKKTYAVRGQDEIVRGTFQKIQENVSVFDHVTSKFPANQEKVALIDGMSGAKYTFADVHTLSKKFGSFLRKKEFQVHDTLAIFTPNCPNYAPVLLGTLGIGGTVSTVNPQYTKRELVNQIIDSNSKVIVTASMLMETARGAAEETGVKLIIALDDESDQDGVISWADIVSDTGGDFKNFSSDLNMLECCACLPYSSGTTGKPKGVVLTHHNLVSNMIQMNERLENVERSILLGLLPFYHIYGLELILLSTLQAGQTIVTLPKFEPQMFLQCISDYKIDFASLVPPLILFLLKSPEVAKYDISSIKYITSGAAPFGVDLWNNFNEKYSDQGISILQGYGLTETSPLTSLTPDDDIKVGSVGKPVINSEIKIIDTTTGEIAGVNKVGEVAIRGPHIMKGYLNNEKATNECITEDGWFLSGDIGYFDEENNLFIVDRFKELIKYKGFQVAPAELEDLLMSHPKIADAAVIGIPDDRAGELPKAFIVTKQDATEEEIVEYIESLVAPSKRLRGGVEFVDEIPKAASGKILRRVLRDKHIK